eukprot:SAG31_NODE_1093_length_9952_cov_16.099056_13_plen_54_part_00
MADATAAAVGEQQVPGGAHGGVFPDGTGAAVGTGWAASTARRPWVNGASASHH